MRKSMIAVLVFFAPFGCASKTTTTPEAPKDDQALLQGRWTPLSAESNSQPAPPAELKDVEVKIDGNKMIFIVKGEEKNFMTFTLDPSKSPKWIDFVETHSNVIVDKDGKESKGTEITEKVKGLYELKDDTLTVCKRMAGVRMAQKPSTEKDPHEEPNDIQQGDPRPTSLSPKERGNTIIFVLKRVK